MVVCLLANQHRTVCRGRAGVILQIADDLRVGIEDVQALVIGHGAVESAFGINGRHRHNAGFVGGLFIVLAVGRRQVHDPGAVVGGHEVGAEYLKSVGRVHEVRERWLIPQTDQIAAAIGAQHLGFFAQFSCVGGQSSLRQHDTVLAGSHLYIGDVGVDGHGLVRRQRPWRRSPYEQVRARQVPVGDGESDREGRVLPALVDVVVHPQLVVGQRGFVTPAVRQHPVALVGQALVPQLFERPDHRFHVGQIERFVIVVEVDPPSLAGYVGPPFIGVPQHRFAAGVVERRDAHRVDLRFVGDAQLPLDLEFGGQPMGVPTEATLYLVATHGAIARHDVFDVAGEQMPVVR